jgi:membrane-associated phospholipid phosphatase
MSRSRRSVARMRLSLRVASSVGTALVLRCATAGAEAAPDHWRDGAYYAVTGGVTGALLAGSLALRSIAPASTPGADPAWFPGDLSLRGRYSASAALLSDATLALTLIEPVAAEAGNGGGPRFVNAELVYTQALSATALLDLVAKAVFHRPRPYTYGLPPEESDPDFYVSFYSGHASVSFSAATSGAYLFAEGARSRPARAFVWGGEMALASLTSGLRVRAGKHYYSDVLVGMLVGIGLGVGVPLLHGERYKPEGEEYAAAASGLLVGAGMSQLLPFPSTRHTTHGAGFDWTVGPFGAPGVSAFGAHGHFL